MEPTLDKPAEPTEMQKELKPITDNYFQLCAQIGDLDTKRAAIDEELDKKRLEIYNLNLKYKRTLEKYQKGDADGTGNTNQN